MHFYKYISVFFLTFDPFDIGKKLGPIQDSDPRSFMNPDPGKAAKQPWDSR